MDQRGADGCGLFSQNTRSDRVCGVALLRLALRLVYRRVCRGVDDRVRPDSANQPAKRLDVGQVALCPGDRRNLSEIGGGAPKLDAYLTGRSSEQDTQITSFRSGTAAARL